MVKNLADELSNILDRIDNRGIGELTYEEARTGLVLFCRGLVCGLRGAQQVTDDTPISVDEAPLEAFKPDWDNAEAKRRADEARWREERRRKSENDKTCPNDEINILHSADKVLCSSEPFPQNSDVSVSIDSKSLRDHS